MEQARNEQGMEEVPKSNISEEQSRIEQGSKEEQNGYYHETQEEQTRNDQGE